MAFQPFVPTTAIMFSSILIVLKSSVNGGVVGSSGFSIGGSTGSSNPPPVIFLADAHIQAHTAMQIIFLIINSAF